MTDCHTETRVFQEHATQVLVWGFPRNIAWTATVVRKIKDLNAVVNGVHAALPLASAAPVKHSAE